MPAVIAIDGPAGAGKSSAARRLAARLGFAHVDTGAMYRVVGVLAVEAGIALEDDAALERLVDALRFDALGDRVLVDGRDLTEAIRRRESGELASRVSARPVVRARLVALQRGLATMPGVVMEGRDIGTVVFPEAPVKFFLTATAGERARRRAVELRAGGEMVDEAALAAEIARRDERDASRPVAPLRPAADATTLDTTGLPLDEVVATMERLARARLGRPRA
ncbi:MAG: (d)CMP kinase [Candidatus Binatia bacterium]